MRVLLINTSERIGGAAVAASRLMEALNRARQADGTDYGRRPAPQLAAGVEVCVGAYRHLESQSLQKEQPLCRGHRKRGH